MGIEKIDRDETQLYLRNSSTSNTPAVIGHENVSHTAGYIGVWTMHCNALRL